MQAKAANIMADALERDADAHDLDELTDVDAHIEDVRRQVLPINNIPEPIYKLALRFWKEWARASRDDWVHYAEIDKAEWPTMARTIAKHVRLGTLPNDKRIIRNFMRRRPPLSWAKIKRLFFGKS